jgi:transmembrane sensor
MSTIAEQRDDRAGAEAGAWLARLQRPDIAEAEGLEFEAWLAAAPGNRAAYRRSLAVWHEFEASAADVLAELEQARGPAVPRTAARRAPTRRWLVGAGGFAMAAGLALALLPSTLMQPTFQTYVTGKGQHQRVTLADGSTIDLNAETRLDVRLAGSERTVVMAEGEAIFDVAPDKRRPFTVQAPSRIVRVVGTQFDVRSRQGELTVTVARGKVQVRPVQSAASGRAFLLTPGQRLAVDSAGVEEVKGVDPQETFSWRAGRLVYRDQPLADVVADLNRQYVDQVEISDPELGRMPITGVIVLDDQSAVMTRLSLMLPIRSVRSDRGLLLLRK